MKIADPYKCDECPNLKQPSNGWFIALDTQALANITTVPHGIGIVPWNDEVADFKGAKHLCSAVCAMKHLARQIDKLQERHHASPNQATQETTAR